jgi:hypothetical protein
MENNTLVNISLTDEGLEIKIAQEAYGNLGVIGALEKVKLMILEYEFELEEVQNISKTKTKYDA